MWWGIKAIGQDVSTDNIDSNFRIKTQLLKELG